MTDTNLLSVANLSVGYSTSQGVVNAVSDVSFDVRRNEVFGIAGESGCGKSTLIRALLRLLSNNGVSTATSITYEGEDVNSFSDDKFRDAILWKRISLVPQSAMNSLNPVYRVGDQVIEAIRAHRSVSRSEARERVEFLFDVVGLQPELMRSYPHEFSGGMRQRAMIAMALACDPDILIADEPTTALDVMVQAQILDLLRTLQSEMNMSVLLISHDLGIVAETCDRVFVMYAGRIVEQASVVELFRNPLHPYTKGLMSSSPRLGKSKKRLPTIQGMVPSPSQRGTGCYFMDRCSKASEYCRHNTPTLEAVGDKHQVACWNYK